MANTINFNDTTPAAPSGKTNVKFQFDTSTPPNASGYVPDVPTLTSELTNDSGFITAAGAPVTSVEGKTGAVTLVPSDIGAAAKGANSDITSLAGLTTPLSTAQGGTGNASGNAANVSGVVAVANGGTGQTTAAAARSALGAAASGANTDITSLGALSWTGDFNANSHALNNLASATLQNGGPLYCNGVGNTFQASRTYTDSSNNLIFEHQQTTNVWVRSVQLSQAGIITFPTPANLNFGSNWQTFVPTFTGSGSMTISSVSIGSAQFCRVGPIVFFQIRAGMTIGGTPSNTILVSAPVAAAGDFYPIATLIATGTFWIPSVGYVNLTGGNITVTLTNGATFSAGSISIFMNGSYRVA